MVTQTNVQVILYKSKQLANGEYPLMLRLTKNRKRKYLSLHLSCPEQTWDSTKNQPKRNNPYKRELDTKIAFLTNAYMDKIMELSATSKTYSLDELVTMVEKPVQSITVKDYFDTVINELKESGKVGNANVYRDSRRVFLNFLNGKDMLLACIDIKILLKYETYLRKRGLAETTISVYFRTLRSLIGKAIQERIMPENMNPFAEFKISKFDTTTQKRALTKTEVLKIVHYKLKEESPLFDSKNYFVFSYLGQGMNFVDMAKLQWRDIQNERVHYIRSKTGKPINFKLLPLAVEILNYYRKLTGSKQTNYVFSILNAENHKTAVQINNRVHKVLTQVNDDLKEIGRKLKIATPITTYVARHSYATVLKHSGTSITIIKEAMGHRSEEITETYLKSFENGEIDEANLKLV